MLKEKVITQEYFDSKMSAPSFAADPMATSSAAVAADTAAKTSAAGPHAGVCCVADELPNPLLPEPAEPASLAGSGR